MNPNLPHAPAEFIVLHSRHSSLVLEVHADEAPIWRYWGPRLPDGATPRVPLRETRPLPSFMLEFDQPLTLLPTFGVGWFGQSALLAHRDGQDFAQAITGCEVEWISLRARCGCASAMRSRRLRIDVTLKLDDASDVLTLQSTLTNLGSAPIDVQWLAAGTLPLPGHADTVRSYAGQHVHEFLLQTDTLSRSLWQRENRRGHTSHDCFPRRGGHHAGRDRRRRPGVRRAPGLVGQPRSRRSSGCTTASTSGRWASGWPPAKAALAPGATLQTPEIVASCSTAGFNGLAANFHAELRSRLNWPGGAMRAAPGAPEHLGGLLLRRAARPR